MRINSANKLSVQRREPALPNVAEGKECLQNLHRLSIRFGVGVDEIVERIALLNGRQADVATVSEQDTVGIVPAEEEFVVTGSIDDSETSSPARSLLYETNTQRRSRSSIAFFLGNEA